MLWFCASEAVSWQCCFHLDPKSCLRLMVSCPLSPDHRLMSTVYISTERHLSTVYCLKYHICKYYTFLSDSVKVGVFLPCPLPERQAMVLWSPIKAVTHSLIISLNRREQTCLQGSATGVEEWTFS